MALIVVSTIVVEALLKVVLEFALEAVIKLLQH